MTEAEPGERLPVRIVTGILFTATLVWIAILLHLGQPLGWDEFEFYRATRWISEGQVPFRDFWEHHTPLQWFLFAPVAYFANGPGASSIVAMRWAQLALWVPIVIIVLRLSAVRAGWWALLFLLSSPVFIQSAVEYRVDVLGNLGFLAAIAAVAFRTSRARWIAFGACMSVAVLANMRLAPLVVFTGALMLFWQVEQRRWQWNPTALWMAAGVAGVAVPFVSWIFLSGAWPGFQYGVFHFNTNQPFRADTLRDMLLAPFLVLDPAALALWGAAVAGCVIAFREIRRPEAPQVLAILFVASIASIAKLEVQYLYHFQGTYLLMLPLAALFLARVARYRWLILTAAAVAVGVDYATVASPALGNPIRYQDYVMREVDRRTRPGDVVFDGTGYALRRAPAYRYWFLPIGLRIHAEQRKVELYDITKNPPAAVIYNIRMQRWFELFPQTAAYAVRHYVPLTRDLWVPGMTAVLGPGRAYTWVAPASGRYTLWPSEVLIRHPWVTRPLDYAKVQGRLAARYAINLRQLPSARVEWSVDGQRVPHSTVTLRKGARVIVVSREEAPVGVLLVPADVLTLAVGPAEDFQF